MAGPVPLRGSRWLFPRARALDGYTFMKTRYTTVIAVVLGLLAVSWLTNRTFAQTSTNRSTSTPALQKAKLFKMDSFTVENLTLDQVIDNLNQQVALRHGGVELRLAATAKEKEQTPITLKLHHTSLAEILDRVAAAADLNLMEEDNVIVLVPKKKAP